jgi:hypothetical protein
LDASAELDTKRASAPVEMELRQLVAANERLIKQLDTGADAETKRRTLPIEIEMRRLVADNDRLIHQSAQQSKIHIEQQHRHMLNATELERLKLLGDGERYVESNSGDLRIELFTRFVRMMQLAGHEPKEDTLKELAKVLLTSHSPRGMTRALRNVIYRVMAGKSTATNGKIIDADA